MTPQIARIDAHRINADTPTRLCYIGPILHTRPDKFAGSRNPLQLGAELYGHAGIESDAEVIALMVEVLAAAGVGEITLDLGHMAIFHGLAAAAALDATTHQRRAGLRHAESLYREGQIDLLQLLDAQRAVLAAELSAIDGQAQLALNTVHLATALGGGWQDMPAATTAAALPRTTPPSLAPESLP